MTTVIDLDELGADPTGTRPSDDAVLAGYTAARKACRTYHGVRVGAAMRFGAGAYWVTPSANRILDKDVSVFGEPRRTFLFGNGPGDGPLLHVGDETGKPGPSGGVQDIMFRGWLSTGAVTGLHVGDREKVRVTGVHAEGFNRAGCRGYLLRSDAGSDSGLEGSLFDLTTHNNTVNVDVDGGGRNGSLDYSTLIVHSVTKKAVDTDTVGLRVVNNAHAYGLTLHLVGNVTASLPGHTATAVQIGNGPDDTARVRFSSGHITMEGDEGPGQLVDLAVDVANPSCGLANNPGLHVALFNSKNAAFRRGDVRGGQVSVGSLVRGEMSSRL